LDNGEALGHFGWFYNQTNLDLSLQLVDTAINFIQNSGHRNAYTLSIINEAINNVTGQGTINTVDTEGVNWMITYLNAALAITEKVNSRIPIMWQDSWMGQSFWSPLFPPKANIVSNLFAVFSHGI
jgi:glucan 1,3-beta-glucosidase